MDATFFTNNRKRLLDKVQNQSLSIFFAGEAPQSSGDQLHPFVPNRNFYYLTGIDQPKQILMLLKNQNTVDELLFIEKGDPVLEKWMGKRQSKEEASKVSGIKKVFYLDDFKNYFQRLMLTTPYEHLYLDLETREWDTIYTPAHLYAREIQERYPYLAIHNIYHAICELRMVKAPEEIEKIREAIRITQAGIRHLMANAKPGMKEYELEAYFDFVLKSNGVKHHAFHTIIGSGYNGTVLHYEENNSTTSDGDLVLLDLGAQFDYYNGDISHTFPINGKFTDRQKLIYNIVLDCLNVTRAMIKPGIKLKEVNAFAKDFLAKACLNIGLINKEEEISKYYFHSVSHFLGLDTHDVGTAPDVVLQPGMVLTVEPGLYIEEESIGIRIEDDVLVTEDGIENLSHDLIRTVEELEAFFANH